MENLNKEYYVAKSFFMIGESRLKCFNCCYCRASLKPEETQSYLKLPEEINPEFKKLPVCVNAFYGDPMLQIENTYQILKRLEAVEHSGPVIIITKGDISKLLKYPEVKLNVHIGLSTFGCDSKYDGGSISRFIKNLETLKNSNSSYHYHIEFRPIIRDINDSDEIFEFVMKMASEFKVPVAYSGLQVNDNLREILKKENIEFKPYDGFEFGLKKNLPDSVTDRLKSFAQKYNVQIFSKTSCLISTVNKTRDYNAHYYRPNEVGCFSCKNKDICFKFKEENNKRTELSVDLPFNYELVYKDKHICELFANGLCKFPSDDCMNISGKMIKISDELTTSDVRLIKWLTGYTVDVKFVELPYIHNEWSIN